MLTATNYIGSFWDALGSNIIYVGNFWFMLDLYENEKVEMAMCCELTIMLLGQVN